MRNRERKSTEARYIKGIYRLRELQGKLTRPVNYYGLNKQQKAVYERYTRIINAQIRKQEIEVCNLRHLFEKSIRNYFVQTEGAETNHDENE